MTRDPRRLSDAARGYNEPPAAPRDRMWERIDAARRDVRPVRTSRPWWQRRALVYPVAVAASLTLGLIIGRGLPESQTGAAPVQVVHDGSDPRSPDTTSAGKASSNGSYSSAARPLLARSEALLVQLQTDASPDVGNYSQRARDLLSLTRLLLASPAGEDDELAPLLSDLELALARLVHLAHGASEQRDLRALQEGLTHQSVLPRLRNQLDAGDAPVGL